MLASMQKPKGQYTGLENHTSYLKALTGLKGLEPATQKHPQLNSMLLRGSNLRNSRWIPLEKREGLLAHLEISFQPGTQ